MKAFCSQTFIVSKTEITASLMWCFSVATTTVTLSLLVFYLLDSSALLKGSWQTVCAQSGLSSSCTSAADTRTGACARSMKHELRRGGGRRTGWLRAPNTPCSVHIPGPVRNPARPHARSPVSALTDTEVGQAIGLAASRLTLAFTSRSTSSDPDQAVFTKPGDRAEQRPGG